MSDSSELERTEAPSARRREQARDEGNIARSPELAIAGALIGGALVLMSIGPMLGAGLRATVAEGLAGSGRVDVEIGGAVQMLRGAVGRVATAMLAWLCAIAGVGLVLGAIQSRGVFSAKPLAPHANRINPLSNLKRLLSPQSAIELLKSLVKFAIVAIAVRYALRAAWTRLMALPQEGSLAIAPLVHRTSVQLLLVAGFCYLALAAADYLWQLWRHEQQLRMTRQELKDEMKESEGDPHVKQRLRSIGRALIRRQMFRDVPKADVVITNPTHIAVALRYDPLECPAPVVIAMGQRKVAERIKRIAAESGVPMIENRPLARALLAAASVGSMIPAELYTAVAEVLAFVIRRRVMRGRPLAEVQA